MLCSICFKSRNVFHDKKHKWAKCLFTLADLDALQEEINVDFSLGDIKKSFSSSLKLLSHSTIMRSPHHIAYAKANLARLYLETGDGEKADSYYKDAIQICKTIGDRQGEGLSLIGLAKIYSAREEFEVVRDYYLQAIAIFESIGDKPHIAITLNNLGAVYDVLNEKKKALTCYEDSVLLYKSVPVSQELATTFSNIGLCLFQLGEYENALKHYERSWDTLKKLTTALDEDIILEKIAILHKLIRNYGKSFEFYQKTLEIKQRNEDRVGQVSVLQSLGELYFQFGHYEYAMTYFNICLEIRKHVKLKRLEDALLHHWRTKILICMGYYRDADFTCREAYELYSSWAPVEETMKFLRTSAKVAQGKREWETALSLYSKQMDFFLQESEIYSIEIAETKECVAELYEEKGEFQKAVELYQEIVGLFEERKQISNMAKCLGNIARITGLQFGQYSSALEIYERILQLYQQQENIVGIATTIDSLATLAKRMGDFQQSIQMALAAFFSFERIIFSNILTDVPLCKQLMENVAKCAAILRTLFFFENRFDNAFLVTEMENHLMVKMLALLQGKQPQVAQTTRNWDPLTMDFDTKLLEMHKSIICRRLSFTLTYSFVTSITGATLLVLFLVTIDGTLITKWKLLDEEELLLLSFLPRLTADLHLTSTHVMRSRFSALYNLLLQPVAQELARSCESTVYIIPTGALAYVPFYSLLDSESGKFTVEKFTICIAQSVQQCSAKQVNNKSHSALLVCSSEGGNKINQKRAIDISWHEEVKAVEMAISPMPCLLLKEELAHKEAIKDVLQNKQYTHIHMTVPGYYVEQRGEPILFSTSGLLLHSPPPSGSHYQAPNITPLSSNKLQNTVNNELELQLSFLPKHHDPRDHHVICNTMSYQSNMKIATDQQHFLHQRVLKSSEIERMDLSHIRTMFISNAQVGLDNYTVGGQLGIVRSLISSGIGTVMTSLWNSSSSQTISFIVEVYGVCCSSFSLLYHSVFALLLSS